MFATDQQLPVYYRIFPGNVHGMRALKLAIKEAGVKNTCVVGDRGFSSEANIHMLNEANYEPLQTRGYDQFFDRSYMQTEVAFAGWMFINHLATMLYYKLMNIIRAKNKLGVLSPKDLLMRLFRISKLRIGQEWVQAAIPLSSKKIFKTLDIVVT